MSVESKIKQLLEGKAEDKEQIAEAEHMAKKPDDLSSVSVGNVGQKTSQEMKISDRASKFNLKQKLKLKETFFETIKLYDKVKLRKCRA